MALDQALLETDGWWLRLTQWNRPCVTLGRFQQWPAAASTDEAEFPRLHPFEIDDSEPEKDGLPAVRRVTGGGSILHGEDLTIAIAGPCPSVAFPERSPASVANRISEILCQHLVAEVTTRGGADREKEMLDVVDCFQRRSPSDIVIEREGQTIKAGGLALAFRPGRVLIEGSLLRDPIARPPHEDRDWLHRVAQSWLQPSGKIGTDPWADLGYPTSMGDKESPTLQQRIDHLVRERFGTASWNRR